MRTRNKPWADNEIEINTLLISAPDTPKGKWASAFGNSNPVFVELGCGKGRFITELALENPAVNFVAIEREKKIIVMALKAAREQGIKNLFFINDDVDRLGEFFDEGEISRLYINFCDPWHRKKKWAKRRLTHRTYLAVYRQLLTEGGEIHFKTDNSPLFEFSLAEFSETGWKIKNSTTNLHSEAPVPGDIVTEYEERFMTLSVPICRLEAINKRQ